MREREEGCGHHSYTLSIRLGCSCPVITSLIIKGVRPIPVISAALFASILSCQLSSKTFHLSITDSGNILNWKPKPSKMAATTGVKTEGELKIKADPDGLTHDIHMGEGDYEDTGELEIPSRRNGAWLTRIPKILYDKWAKIDDDEEIQLGIVRRYRDSGAVRTLSIDYNMGAH